MVVVNLTGGLGNQMFQYALYMSFLDRGIEAKLDVSHIRKDMDRVKRCTIFDSFVLDKNYKQHGKTYDRVLQYIGMPVYKKIAGSYHEKVVGKYDPEVLNINKGYIDGYWQTEKYFEHNRTEIIRAFSARYSLSNDCKAMLEKIQSENNSVSLHIRLGDYNTLDNQRIFGNICTEEYYLKALQHIKERYQDAKFYVFSNDVSGAKQLLGNNDFEIVDINDESTAYMDMYLMSCCKHNIIANSTFSWWGAWLNENSNKIVVAPAKWINTREMPDICPDSWVRI